MAEIVPDSVLPRTHHLKRQTIRGAHLDHRTTRARERRPKASNKGNRYILLAFSITYLHERIGNTTCIRDLASLLIIKVQVLKTVGFFTLTKNVDLVTIDLMFMGPFL